MLVSVKVEFLRVPEIDQCSNVNAYNLAGTKSGMLRAAYKYLFLPEHSLASVVGLLIFSRIVYGIKIIEALQIFQ